NGRIAMLAAQRGKRPEKLKQEMSKDGTLANMYIQMREQKATDKLLENAQIEEVDLQTAAPTEEAAEEEKPKVKASDEEKEQKEEKDAKEEKPAKKKRSTKKKSAEE